VWHKLWEALDRAGIQAAIPRQEIYMHDAKEIGIPHGPVPPFAPDGNVSE